MPPSLSVVICSLNGCAGLDRCLRALSAQSARSALEVIVVDDGSSEPVGDVARVHGAVVVQHERTRGISAARNSGIQVASAPIVAFLDDDCEPEKDWAERLISVFTDDVIGVGGRLLVSPGSAFILKYLARHNPLDPQEVDLAKSTAPAYRFFLYLRRQWTPTQPGDSREVFSLASANMAVRRAALAAVGGFDERIRFGSEDEDLCRRLARAYPHRHLIFDPAVRVVHHFEPSLRDTMRRSRAYGRGSAVMYRKWPEVRPTVFPFPVLVLALAGFSFLSPAVAAAALLAPQLLYPSGPRAAITERDALCLLDPYVQLLQETCDLFGFAEGWWRFRDLPPERSTSAAGFRGGTA